VTTAPHPIDRPRGAREREVVDALAREMVAERIPMGDQAALRRERLGPAFWRVVLRHLEPAGLLSREDSPSRGEDERIWSAILAELARAAPLHVRGHRLGTALAEAGVAEARVLRLARAHREGLRKAVRAIAQQLVAGGQRADWSDLAVLLLADGSNRDEGERRRLCLDYYRAREHGSRVALSEEET
jgi:CRISPR-associated protein Cse2 (CRISPR_cse2)